MELNEQIEFQKIANYIASKIDEPFSKAWIYMEMEEDNDYYEGRYKKLKDDEKGYFLIGDLSDSLRELWFSNKEQNVVPWHSATFILLPDKSFTMNYNFKINE